MRDAPAPIAIFAFNRPGHLRRTLEALAANTLAAESAVTIYCDGPRHERDMPAIKEVLSVANSAAGFHSCTVIRRENNWGLAKNIISGVSEQLDRNDRVIVLEDDLITSPYFLKYMNDGLTVYANDSCVASIHGYLFPSRMTPKGDTFFLKGADCYGWATWRRSWKFFDADALLLYDKIKKNNDYINFNRRFSYPYMEMLMSTHKGEISSWAIRWLASAWINNMYTLYPSRSLVSNIGMDGSGTNCGKNANHDVNMSCSPINVEKIAVKEDKIMASELIHFLEVCSGGKIQRIKRYANYYAPFLRNWYIFFKKIFRR